MRSLGLKIFVMASAVCLSFANAVDLQADKTAINSACRKDADAAGCKNMTMGKGLGKCMFAYKRKNPKYSPSAGCKAAMTKFHQDKLGNGGGINKANTPVPAATPPASAPKPK